MTAGDVWPALPSRAIVLCSVLIAACTGDEPDQAVPGVVDSAGVRVVENGPLGFGTPLRLADVPEFRVGWEEGDQLFTAIGDGVLTADGGAVVMDYAGRLVYRFAPDGSLRFRVGGAGEGPGEFGGPWGMALLPGDSILVAEASRATVLGPDGRFIRSFGTVSALGGSSHRPSPYTRDRRILWLSASYSFPLGESGRQWIDGRVVSTDGFGEAVDTLVTLPVLEVVFEPGAASVPPFGARGVMDSWTGGFAWARTDRSEVVWYSDDGEVVQIARWPGGARPVTDSVWDAYVRVRVDAAVARGVPEAGVAELRRSLADDRGQAAATVPYFTDLAITSGGTVWLTDDGEVARPSRGHLVFSRDGTRRGLVEVPGGFRLVDASDTHVLGVERDEFDVQAVAVYRLIGGGG